MENKTINIYVVVSYRKWKHRFSLIHLPFAHHATEVCCLSVCWRRHEGKLSVCKLTTRTKQTYPSMMVGSIYENSPRMGHFYLSTKKELAFCLSQNLGGITMWIYTAPAQKASSGTAGFLYLKFQNLYEKTLYLMSCLWRQCHGGQL